MTHSFSCTGRATDLFTPARFELIVQALGEHSVQFQRDRTTLSASSERGKFEITQDARDLVITLSAPSKPLLFALHDQTLHIAEHADAAFLPQIAWSGTLPDQGAPNNFRLAQLVEVTRPFPNFFRVTLHAPDLTQFTTGGMHFRLLLPPQGRSPVWPYIDETGRTRFPTGADQLHNPVYTFVSFDVAQNLFTFDVFIHEGGRITEWVRAANTGDTIGMMGPGGGTMPNVDQIVLAGDETALPAIRRILAETNPTTTGRVMIEVQSRDDIQPLTHPAGVDVAWMLRDIDPCPVDVVMAEYADVTPQTAPFLWCGTEKSKVQRARKHFREIRGISAEHSYFSGYWRKARA
jgi:NADPH-dependent ferric siderophore reductase